MTSRKVWPEIPPNSVLANAIQGTADQNKLGLTSTIQYWGFFERAVIQKSNQLLMLDIDFGRQCSLGCPTCYRRSSIVDDTGESDLTYDELLAVIRDAKKLGLQSIKICGAGEPFEHPKLLDLATQLTEMDIGLAIFTKGHVLGQDELAASIFGQYGITNGESLAAALFKLKVSIMLNFMSANSDLQDALVGKIAGYSHQRNRAAEILAQTGFNTTIPTRLALTMAPVTPATYKEAYPLYVYCRQRNILPILPFLMVSGKQIKGQMLKQGMVDFDRIVTLWTDIYQYNVEHGLQSLESILSADLDEISCMPGIHPCNQIAVGLYVTANGNVVPCPGSTQVLGNVRQESIEQIWHQSQTWTKQYNVFCPFKEGITLPDRQRLYRAVRRNLDN